MFFTKNIPLFVSFFSVGVDPLVVDFILIKVLFDFETIRTANIAIYENFGHRVTINFNYQL